MLGRIVWGLGKLTVKYVLLPIAITAGTAVVLEALADRVAPKDAVDDGEPNGMDSDLSSDVDRANLAV